MPFITVDIICNIYTVKTLMLGSDSVVNVGVVEVYRAKILVFILFFCLVSLIGSG